MFYKHDDGVELQYLSPLKPHHFFFFSIVEFFPIEIENARDQTQEQTEQKTKNNDWDDQSKSRYNKYEQQYC
jgi:hypothetical protein